MKLLLKCALVVLACSLAPASADPALDLGQLGGSINSEQPVPAAEVPPDDRAEICPEIIVGGGDVEI